VSESLDWSGIDKADFGKLNKVVWYSLHGDKAHLGEVDSPTPP
jgi:hypothetical protein